MSDFAWADLDAALGLAIVLEGAAYALFPEPMKRMMAQVLTTPAPHLRLAGLGAMVVGLLAVWAVRG